MMKQLCILIADDHPVIRAGLKILLHQHVDLHVVGEASSGEEAVEQAMLLKPDIVVMDIRMPGMSGLDACRKITEQLPDTRVIILTSFAEDSLLFDAVKAGAAGYVLKRSGSNDLVRTIQAVAQGQSILNLALTEAMFKQVTQLDNAKEETSFGDLSAQELRVLALVTEGSTNRQIAGRLFLGEGTVRNYVSVILNKLHVANRAEAAAFAVHHKLADHMPLE
jgi:two-component system response regulator DevR